MAFHLLERDRAGAIRLAQILQEAVNGVGNCRLCRNLCDEEICSICSDPQRAASSLCVVETPADVAVIEQSGVHRGRYFVLMGHLSPLDGIGPAELALDRLESQLEATPVEELILATNTTVEGEATAQYLAEMARSHGVRPTRIAQGVPLGGELEFVDGGTLSHAFAGRREF